MTNGHIIVSNDSLYVWWSKDTYIEWKQLTDTEHDIIYIDMKIKTFKSNQIDQIYSLQWKKTGFVWNNLHLILYST